MMAMSWLYRPVVDDKCPSGDGYSEVSSFDTVGILLLTLKWRKEGERQIERDSQRETVGYIYIYKHLQKKYDRLYIYIEGERVG